MSYGWGGDGEEMERIQVTNSSDGDPSRGMDDGGGGRRSNGERDSHVVHYGGGSHVPRSY